jgi:putative transposase
MISSPCPFWVSFSNWILHQLKDRLKPTTVTLALGALVDVSRTKADLLVENAILRQQVIVLRRQVKRPRLTHKDRLRLVLLARCTKFWAQALHIIQPDTLLRWHRDLFRLFWRYKSGNWRKKPRISPETIGILRQMIRENRLWGAERIRGELLKLGITLSKRTIQKYIHRIRKYPSPDHSWATFIRNHAGDIWACDFTTVYDWLFRPLYIFVIMELKKRRIIHVAVTDSPTDEWTAQQLREATAWGEKPKYLIRDRDSKYGNRFTGLAFHTGIQVLKTPFRAPKANAYSERLMGSLKRECLDHFIILNRRHLTDVVKEYAVYYNGNRPHQGINQLVPSETEGRIPVQLGRKSYFSTGNIQSVAFLGGLHHSYSRGAAPP